MATDCPTIGPWFVKFVRGVNLRVGVIREQYLGMSALTIFALQRVWDIEWKSVKNIHSKNCGNCGSSTDRFLWGSRGRRHFMDSLTGML